MDTKSLPQAQQQQLLNRQPQLPQPHDPSQYHQYRPQPSRPVVDYSHYHQNRPQNHHFAPQLDPRHGYYRPDLTSTYQQPRPQVSAARFGPPQHHQNMYFYPNQPPAAYPDLNAAAAAAVAALSQLNQIVAAGNVGRGPMAPQVRRPRHPVNGPFKRRRGRNQVPWGYLLDKSSNSELPVAKDGETVDGDGGPSAWKPKPRCELCKVECSSMEILVEKHNNGRKHKKNMRKAEKLKKAIKSSPAVQGEQNLVAESICEVPQQTETQQNCKENKTIIEDSAIKAVEAGGDGNQVEAEQQEDTGHGEGPAAEIKLNAYQTETQQNCEENKPMIEDSGVKAVGAGGDGNQVESEQQKEAGDSEDPAAEMKLNADQTETQQNCEENKPMIVDSVVKDVEADGDGNQVESEQQKDAGHNEDPAAEMKLNADQTETQPNCEEDKPMIEDSVVKAVEAGGDGNQVETEQQKDTGHSEDPAAEIKLNADQPDNRKGLRKRKRRTEPSIPKVKVIPLVCELCNVKCNTRETFDSHLAGRKHVYKVKTFRLRRHPAPAYRPTGLQVLYPPNPILQTLLSPQYHQLQFQIPRSSFPPPATYAPPRPPHHVLPAASGIGLQLQGAALNPGGQTAVSVAQKPELATAQPKTT